MRIVLENYLGNASSISKHKKQFNHRQQSPRGGCLNLATSKIDLFAIIANNFQLLIVIAKRTISDLVGFVDRHLHIYSHIYPVGANTVGAK